MNESRWTSYSQSATTSFELIRMPSNCSLEDICTGACDIVLGPNNAEDVAVSVSVSVLSSVGNAGTVKDVVKVVGGSILQLRAGT